jgi:tRNA G37 N-methylase Trm5
VPLVLTCAIDSQRADAFYDGTSFRVDALVEFLNDVDEFVRLLAVAVHVLSGMPARAPELLTITYKNTKETLRSLYHSHAHGNRIAFWPFDRVTFASVSFTV